MRIAVEKLIGHRVGVRELSVQRCTQIELRFILFFFAFSLLSPLPRGEAFRHNASLLDGNNSLSVSLNTRDKRGSNKLNFRKARGFCIWITAAFSVAVELRPEFFKRPPSRNGNLAFFTTWTCATIVQRLILINRLIHNCNTCVVLWNLNYFEFYLPLSA